MKKIAALLLVLALFLTACSRPAAPESTQTASETKATQSAVPTERPTLAPTEPAQTEPPVTEPEETEAPVTEPPEETGYRAGGTPTAGGVLVWTDPSAYRPYAGFGAKYTRLREGPLDRFEPSDDYGAVYPYVAAWMNRANHRYDIDWMHSIFSYGFVDASGRILTDGIFRDVQLLVSSDESSLPTAYWKVSITDGYEGEVIDFGDGDSMTWNDPVFLYGLISADGSFAMDCIYRGIEDTGGGFFCRKNQESLGFDVYDYNMELLFTEAELLDGIDCDWINMSYSEGLFQICATKYMPPEGEEYYSGAEDTYWYCDESGTRVLGPYQNAFPFSEGLACVSEDGERCGYIDRTGAWVIEPNYRARWESFENGRAIQIDLDDRIVILDRNGEELFHLPGNSCYSEPCGYMTRNGYSSDSDSFYDPDGKLLLSEAELGVTLRCLDENRFYYYELDNPNCTLRIVDPERTLLSVPTYVEFYEGGNAWPDDLTRGVCRQDGELLLGWYGGMTADNSERIFIPEDCSGVITVREPALPSLYVDQIFQSVSDPFTGDTWYFCWTGTAWEGRSESGTRWTVPLRAVELQPAGSVLYAHSEDASVLVDRNGEIIFRSPIDDED